MNKNFISNDKQGQKLKKKVTKIYQRKTAFDIDSPPVSRNFFLFNII